MKNFTNNSAFLIRAPKIGDSRPRNAFGILKSFGWAYDTNNGKDKAAVARRAKLKNSKSF